MTSLDSSGDPLRPPLGGREGAPRPSRDPLGTAALVSGCVGILVLGLVLTVVTAFLAALAGSSARAAGRSLENAYLGFALAAIDGVTWIFLHLMFDIPFLLG